MAKGTPVRDLKCYTPMAMLFVSFLLVANIVAVKPIYIGPFLEPLSILVYPLTYVIAVAITEVYGYAHARQVIWWAMLANLFMAMFFHITIAIPSTPAWALQQTAYATVLGSSARVILASLASFLVSEFINAFIISKLKVAHKGKHFWVRAMLAMTLSEAAGTVVFITGAFYGVLSYEELLNIGGSYYMFKVIYAAVAVPILSVVTRWLKRVEGVDTFDTKANFNPFAMKD